MNTPIHPPIALPIVWDTSYLCVLMNSMEHAGIRHAQEPMNTGKQAVPSTPSRRQVAIHGAYRPKPISIRAPHKILSPAATINFHPVKPVAVPTAPKGPTPVFLQSGLEHNNCKRYHDEAKSVSDLVTRPLRNDGSKSK